MRSLFSAVAVSSFLFGCSGVEASVDDAGSADASVTVDVFHQLPDDAGLPCQIAELVARRCSVCHGAPPTAGAPMALLTRADFGAKSSVDPTKNQAQRSLARMAEDTMPPGGRGLGATDLVTFDSWVQAGFPGGSCEAVDAGTTEPTCASNQFAPRPVPLNTHRGANMAPGFACISCHSGQNFAGQNPGGLSAPRDIYDYMGTVFVSRHDKDLCLPTAAIDARVEIYDLSGKVVTTMQVLPSGNFGGLASGTIPSKYRAKVITAEGARMMTTAQSNGDCNTCHTVAGTTDAPGRIFLP